ncbi:hypothetical protein B0H16DRAFT_1467677 [Mycena metata]|uniref:Uncharacterized protein n=1 Tax=Mycena metata TaxID=1033252 RepID=A0AAD7I4Z6_9AGAR|nr:hypothetical protein B0H16DRAFT_1467677 [Mycena metata]
MVGKGRQRERIELALKATTASHALNFGDFRRDSTWKVCKSVVIGSWVFAKPEIYGVCYVPLDRFIISSHALHNAHLLRATLPRALLAPIPLFDDRRRKHNELADQLRTKRDSQPKRKRKRTEEPEGDNTTEPERPPKRRKKAAKKKKSAPPALAAAEEEEDDEDEESELESEDSDIYDDWDESE